MDGGMPTREAHKWFTDGKDNQSEYVDRDKLDQ